MPQAQHSEGKASEGPAWALLKDSLPKRLPLDLVSPKSFHHRWLEMDMMFLLPDGK